MASETTTEWSIERYIVTTSPIGKRKSWVATQLMRAQIAVMLGLLVAVGLPTAALAKYASIIIDAKSGEVLHEAGADTRNFPASLTKMMTLHMVFDALKAGKLKLADPMKVSAHASGMAPSKLGLRPGDTITVEQCVLALVTKSANDCAAVIAETIGGTEVNFARMMTDRARQLGMTRTTFRNASGLPNTGQLSTARDMARLAQSLIYDHAQYYGYFNTKSFTYKGTTIGSHNRLMARYPGMDGLKTGYIRASGFNLASSAVRDGRRLIGVVFGGQTAAWRDNHMADLLDEAFKGKKSAPMLVASADAKAKSRPAKSRNEERSVVAAVASEIVNSAEEIALPRTAVAAPVAASLPKVNANGRWAIQVGAFNDKQASQRAVSQATQRAGTLLDSATPQVMEVSTAKGKLYRARLTGMDEKTARRACAQLSKGGHSCLTVPPAA